MYIIYIYLCRTKWVEICGTTYKCLCVLIVGVEDEFPLFGKVASVYIIDKSIVFNVCVLHTCSYDPHYHAYLVNHTTEMRFVQYKDLVTSVPLHAKKIPDKNELAIVLKHRLPF